MHSRHRAETLSRSTAPPGAGPENPLQSDPSSPLHTSEESFAVSEIIMGQPEPINAVSFSDLPTLPIDGNLFAEPFSAAFPHGHIEFSDTSSSNTSPALSEPPQISAYSSTSLPNIAAIAPSNHAHSSTSSLPPYSFPDPPDHSADSAQASLASLYGVPNQGTPNPPVIEVSNPDGANHYYFPTPPITSPHLHDDSPPPEIAISGPDETNNYHLPTTDQTSFDQLDLPETFTNADEEEIIDNHVVPAGVTTDTDHSCMCLFRCFNLICDFMHWIGSKFA